MTIDGHAARGIVRAPLRRIAQRFIGAIKVFHGRFPVALTEGLGRQSFGKRLHLKSPNQLDGIARARTVAA